MSTENLDQLRDLDINNLRLLFTEQLYFINMANDPSQDIQTMLDAMSAATELSRYISEYTSRTHSYYTKILQNEVLSPDETTLAEAYEISRKLAKGLKAAADMKAVLKVAAKLIQAWDSTFGG